MNSPDANSNSVAVALDAPIHRFVMPNANANANGNSTGAGGSHSLQTPQTNRQQSNSSSNHSRQPTPTPTQQQQTNGNVDSSTASGSADGLISKSLWSSGRAAWYTSDGSMKAPFIVGISGASASGKTTVCDEIVSRLSSSWVTMICIDRFYKPLSEVEREQVKVGSYNFDAPLAFDFKLAYESILQLKSGRSVSLPCYDFVTHSRSSRTDECYGSDVIIIEGILSMYDSRLRSLMDLKVYVDTEADVCLARRIVRDMAERGRDLQDVLRQYFATVKPSFDAFVHPTQRFADICLPRGGDNEKAIDILVQHIRAKLVERNAEANQQMNESQQKQSDSQQQQSANQQQQNGAKSSLLSPSQRTSPTTSNPTSTSLLLSPTLASSASSLNSSASAGISSTQHRTRSLSLHAGQQLPSNAIIMKSTPVLTHIHTTIRDANTGQDEFQFALHRLSHLLFAAGVDVFHFQAARVAAAAAASSPPPLASIETPTGDVFRVPQFSLDIESSLCCVSIVRGGEALEQPIRECIPNIIFGKIVIAQTCSRTEGARLYYCKLPGDIAAPSRRILLLEATLSTGNALCMAIRVLLDHGCQETQIVVLCVATSIIGLRTVAKAFPRVTVVSSWLDSGLDDQFYLCPGIGAVGDRYFNTQTYNSSYRNQQSQSQKPSGSIDEFTAADQSTVATSQLSNQQSDPNSIASKS